MAFQRSLSSRSQETSDLLQNFVEEFASENVVRRIHQVGHDAPTSADVQRLGSDLRGIAVDFANSPHRAQVTAVANQQGLQNLTFAQVKQILSDLMSDVGAGGQYLMERIVVAFYFCCDILKRIADWAVEKVKEFFYICRDAVISVVNPIVERLGGWHAILLTIGTYIARRCLGY